jgi:glycosyltransferase involved in cell wall biosynthesis
VVSESGEREGLGVVLLEAMACGSPVIGTNTGGIPDIVKDGETGLLARQKDPGDLADKILRVLLEDELRAKLKRSALCFVRENFSWPSIAEKFKKVYEGALRKGL